MTEKKTFKGVELGTYYPAPEIPWEWIAGGQHFKHTEWDMEVTFTRKPKPIQINSVVRHRNWPVWLESGEPIYFVVKAIIGKQAWIGCKDQRREDMLTSVESLYFDDQVSD